MNTSAYLKRLHLDINLNNDYKTLKTLHRAQAFSIPFENFNVQLKRPIPLDKESLFQKLIVEQKGGYCYELNILFYFLLQELGFETTLLIGRPLYGYKNAIRPKTHMVLKVHIEGISYLCDLGFGGRGLIEPLELVYEKENEQFGDIFKLIPHTEGYELQCKIEDHWVPLYSFDLNAQNLIDYELANFFNRHSEDSRFTQQIICAMPTPEGRILLLDKEFKSSHGRTEITSNEQYNSILKDNFGIFQNLAEALFTSKNF
ncbi:arylamine N-acetyltransferase [Sulfurimonas sp. MAG313]|nr:arylamine N-acetyltransferase [Sulfurimonas sp. MAG313]MDF1882009.1 arylamine N-acetyltransferase [Sulfurimonas sp. MAG313]